jgi:hypothetical protein
MEVQLVVEAGQQGVGSQEVLAVSPQHYHCLALPHCPVLPIKFLPIEELELHAWTHEGVGFEPLLLALSEGLLAVESMFEVLQGQGFFWMCEIDGDDVMLQFEVVLLALVEAPKDVDLVLEFVGTAAHTCAVIALAFHVYPLEHWLFGALGAQVEVVQYFWVVWSIDEFEEEGGEEVVLAGPVEDEKVLAFTVVPVGQHEEFAKVVLFLEHYGGGQALLLLEGLFIALPAA